MQNHDIFSATLGLSHPWKITNVLFAKEGERLDITIALDEECVFTCPTCGKEGIPCDTVSETWYHDDFFRFATYLHARVPRIECSCCGILPVERPWSRTGSKFAPLELDEM
jgi:transposase